MQRLDNARHRLEIERDDGTRDVAELQTRSVLLHDLVHYAVEAEAGVHAGFWGRLAAGAGLARGVGVVIPGSAAL